MCAKRYGFYTDRYIKTMSLARGDCCYVVAFQSMALSLPTTLSSLRFAGNFQGHCPSNAQLNFDIHNYRSAADVSLFWKEYDNLEVGKHSTFYSVCKHTALYHD